MHDKPQFCHIEMSLGLLEHCRFQLLHHFVKQVGHLEVYVAVR